MLFFKMRKLPAITMLLLLGLTLFAPLLDLSSSSLLPECCRRNGQHHCMGEMMPPASSKTVSTISPKCPRFPVATVAPLPHTLLPRLTSSAGVLVFVHPASLPQTEARYRIAFAHSRQKRGPPVIPA